MQVRAVARSGCQLQTWVWAAGGPPPPIGYGGGVVTGLVSDSPESDAGSAGSRDRASAIGGSGQTDGAAGAESSSMLIEVITTSSAGRSNRSTDVVAMASTTAREAWSATSPKMVCL